MISFSRHLVQVRILIKHQSPSLHSNPLPQGLSLDPRDGTISGYPTCEVTSSMVTIQMDFQQYHFETEVRIEVMGCRYIDYESLNSYSITKSN